MPGGKGRYRKVLLEDLAGVWGKRRGAGCSDDGGEHSGEEAAGITLLFGEIAAYTGERETEVELPSE